MKSQSAITSAVAIFALSCSSSTTSDWVADDSASQIGAQATFDGLALVAVDEGTRDWVPADGLLAGRILIEDECILATNDDGTFRHLIRWPIGTTWDAENNEIIVPDSPTFRNGDYVEGGGAGPRRLDDLIASTETIQELERCLSNTTDRTVLGFNVRGPLRYGGPEQ